MFNNKDIKEINIINPANEGEPDYPGVPNVELVQIRREVKDNNESFIFKFQRGKDILEHREFTPVLGNILKTQEEVDKAFKLMHSRVAHIARAFVSQAEFDAVGDQPSWLDYMKATYALLGVLPSSHPTDPGGVTRAKGVKCKLKVVIVRSKYSGLPKIPPFISTENHPKSFTVNPEYDIMKIPAVKPDSETGKATATTATGTSSAGAAPAAGGTDW